MHQCINSNHNYPDGLMLFLGTMFTPVMDRDIVGKGFTHKLGDIIRIKTSSIGSLINRVNFSNFCEPWDFGCAELIRNLKLRGL